MTTNPKPRVRVRAQMSWTDPATQNNVRAILEKAASEVADAVDVAPQYNPDFQGQLANFDSETGRPLPMSGKGTEYTSLRGAAAAQMMGLVRAYANIGLQLDRSEEARKSEYHGLLHFVSAASRKLGMPEIQKAADQILAESAADVAGRKARLTDIADTLKSVLKLISKADDEEAEAEENDDVEKAVKAVKALQTRVTKALEVIQAAEKAEQHGPDWQSKQAQKDSDEKEAGERQEATKSMSLTQVFERVSNHVNPAPDLTGRTTALAKADTGREESTDHLSVEDITELMTQRQRAAWLAHNPGFSAPWLRK